VVIKTGRHTNLGQAFALWQDHIIFETSSKEIPLLNHVFQSPCIAISSSSRRLLAPDRLVQEERRKNNGCSHCKEVAATAPVATDGSLPYCAY
jgi:hypothetical protein